MLLRNFKIPTKARLKRFETFVGSLMEQGYQELGSGSYATVYGKPKGRIVVKVGNCVGKPEHDAYLNYVKLVTTTSVRNPHVPKIFGVNVYYDPYHGWWYTVKMERLHELEASSEHEKIVKNMNLTLQDITDLGSSYFSVRKQQKAPAQWVSLHKKLRNMLHGHKFMIDMIGNIMVRKVRVGKSYIVVTDPVA